MAMKIGRIDIKDENGHLISWWSHGQWNGMTSILPKAIHLMVTSFSKQRSAFQIAIEHLPILPKE